MSAKNSHWRLSSHYAEKVNLRDTRDNDIKARKVSADRNKLYPGKEWRLYAQ